MGTRKSTYTEAGIAASHAIQLALAVQQRVLQGKQDAEADAEARKQILSAVAMQVTNQPVRRQRLSSADGAS